MSPGREANVVTEYLEEWFDEVENLTPDPNDPKKRNPRDAARHSMSFRVQHAGGEVVLVVADNLLDDWSPEEVRQKLESANTAETLRNAFGKELMMLGDGRLIPL